MKRAILVLAVATLPFAIAPSDAAPGGGGTTTQNVNIQSSSISVPVTAPSALPVTVSGTPNVTVTNGTTNPVNVAVVNGTSYTAVYPTVSSFAISLGLFDAYQVFYTNNTSSTVVLTAGTIYAIDVCTNSPFEASFDVGLIRNVTDFVDIKTRIYVPIISYSTGSSFGCTFTATLPGPLAVPAGYSARAYARKGGNGTSLTLRIGAAGYTLP